MSENENYEYETLTALDGTIGVYIREQVLENGNYVLKWIKVG